MGAIGKSSRRLSTGKHMALPLHFSGWGCLSIGNGCHEKRATGSGFGTSTSVSGTCDSAAGGVSAGRGKRRGKTKGSHQRGPALSAAGEAAAPRRHGEGRGDDRGRRARDRYQDYRRPSVARERRG